jgi:hypothetical protein
MQLRTLSLAEPLILPSLLRRLVGPRLPAAIVASMVIVCAWANSSSATDEGTQFFETEIRPLLIEHCYECHSTKANKTQGGLLVDSRESLRAGGDSGPAVVPGDVEKSLLLDALRYQFVEMPPAGKLDDSVIAKFKQWILAGAADPREAPAPPTGANKINWDEASEHWAFQPIVPKSVTGYDDRGLEGSIDAFVSAKLKQADLEPNPPASRSTWLRRVTFDLIGLPPTPEEMHSFLQDDRPDSYERVVDRLLASPRYGERYGRHWLDLARYADSNGADENHAYPVAWRYRDYVVDAFNQDVPYDQFTVEQLAGDLLPFSSEQERGRNLTATGFLVMGPKMLAEQDKPKLVADLVDEQVDTVGKVFLGLTLGCARCHDHKFDPIKTQDYYSLAGIFHSTKSMEHLQFVSQWNEIELPNRERSEQIAAHQRLIEQTESQASQTALELHLKLFERQLAAFTLQMKWNASSHTPSADEVANLGLSEAQLARMRRFISARDWRDVATINTIPQELQSMIDLPFAADPESAALSEEKIDLLHKGVSAAYSTAWRKVLDAPRNDKGKITDGPLSKLHKAIYEEGPFEEITKLEDAVSADDKARLLAVREKVEALKKAMPALDRAMATVDGPVKLVAVNVRGNHLQTAGDPLPRNVPIVLQTTTSAVAFPAEQSGRWELANWLVAPEHPLTSRVMVNRLWQYHFGEGLVRSSSNFGLRGELPTHPELLDRLAADFVAQGWSMKSIHRKIVLSATYRRTSDDSEIAPMVDPENRLLWRMNRKRLEVEPLRDSLLSVANEMDWQMTGQASSVYGNTFEDTNQPRTLHDAARRTIYLPINRAALEEFFSTFDYVDSAVSLEKRPVTTVPHQALYLMNHRLALHSGWRLAHRLEQHSSDEVERLNYAYAICFCRVPTEAELVAARTYLQQQRTQIADSEETDKLKSLDPWIKLCRGLLLTSEFIYVD